MLFWGNMRKSLILVPLILFVLLSSFGLCVEGFKGTIYAIKQNVYPGEVGEFRVEVTNEMPTADRFTIYTQSMKPGWFYQQDYSLDLLPNTTKTTKIYVTPDENAEAGNRGFFIYIYPKSDLENYLKLEAFVTVVRDEKLSVSGLRTTKTSYVPGEIINLTGQIKNVAAYEIGSYSLMGTLNNTNNSVSIPMLKPGSTFYFNIPIRVDEKLVGVQNIILNVINTEGEIESSKSIRINIPPIQSISIDKSDKSFFFWHTYKIEIKNTGNVKKESQIVSGSINRLKSYLMKSNLKIASKEKIGGGIKYNWVIKDLEPGETILVKYRINYWILFLIALFVFGTGYFAMYEFQVPKIMKVARISKGEHTIYIYIKNNTKELLTKVRVIDHVPEIVKLSNKFEAAKPTSIKNKKGGIEIEWKIGNLNPGEERILSYKFRPILKVEGTVKLPKAQFEFFFRKRDRIRNSEHAITYF